MPKKLIAKAYMFQIGLAEVAIGVLVLFVLYLWLRKK